MKKSYIGLVITALLLITVIFFQINGLPQIKPNEKIENWSSSKLNSAIKSNQIEQINVQPKNNVYQINGVTRNGTEFRSEVLKDQKIINDMVNNDVRVNMHQIKPDDPWWENYSIIFVGLTLFFKITPLIILILILLYLKKIHDIIKINMSDD